MIDPGHDPRVKSVGGPGQLNPFWSLMLSDEEADFLQQALPQDDGDSSTGHEVEHNIEEALPTPLTTRNLHSRLRTTSIVRAVRSRTASAAHSRATSSRGSSHSSATRSDTRRSQDRVAKARGKKKASASSSSAVKRARMSTVREAVDPVSLCVGGSTSGAESSSRRRGKRKREESPLQGFSTSGRKGKKRAVEPEPEGRQDDSDGNGEETKFSGTPDRPRKDKGKQRAVPTPPSPTEELPSLSEYQCPICFFPPTNATLTPCGHVCCGSCLFTAVKTTMRRNANVMQPVQTQCPVCRAVIPGWNGRGGGVIGLKVAAVFSQDAAARNRIFW
ncbi:hypothetical protein FISHEDRAFT_63022 [Fistulina hepatica ATCC 64428]|uniref:RING-type domain-containing protein n=1 Tax=Fistulina hepatica ATCC 64428 TaxID=1128425 RepID=A0A0D6ZZL3_9AGAR|nr:hypothetical protein FISHEDRAFT_63022 [Fistulina hepatica ATCC 64428]